MLVRLNKGIRCKTGTRRADPSCCKHGADFLSAKAGHWGNLRRREAAWTEPSERASQKTYKLCENAQHKQKSPGGRSNPDVPEPAGMNSALRLRALQI